jgi:hypothetical protein
MPFWKSRERGPQEPLAAEINTDWSFIANVRAEWPQTELRPDDDLRAWREGVRLYDSTDDYQSMIEAGSLQSRALRHELYGPGILANDDLPNTVHQVLYASTATPPDGKTLVPRAARQLRLALTVMKKHSWQPRSMGGDDTFQQMVERSYLLLTTVVAPNESRGWEGDLSAFFARHPLKADDFQSNPAATSAIAQSGDEPIDNVINRIQATIDAADAGDSASQLRVRAFASQRNGDATEALRLYEEAANLGNIEAMYDAGCLCDESGAMSASHYWWELGADRGHANSAYNRAVSAYRTQDFEAAGTWYERAASLGDVSAYAALTQLADERGDGAAERHWAKLGADAGHPFCLNRHSYFLVTDSDGDRGTLFQAKTYSTRSADQGDVEGMYSVGLISGQLGNPSEARQWLLRAEAAGHPNARAVITKYGL